MILGSVIAPCGEWGPSWHILLGVQLLCMHACETWEGHHIMLMCIFVFVCFFDLDLRMLRGIQ